ncbi:sensor histidine kinase [Sphaerisporangium aureirubrum]|uniref:histidine kinase n=1 Tax=Sphaerisporangium aureirubrum TaxID=1544736 RepID=A0ABW1N8F5_9ACTN
MRHSGRPRRSGVGVGLLLLEAEQLFGRRYLLVRLMVLGVLAAGYLMLLTDPRTPPGSWDWGFTAALVAVGVVAGVAPLAAVIGHAGLLTCVGDLAGPGAVAMVKIAASVALFELAARRPSHQVIWGSAAVAAGYVAHVFETLPAGLPPLLYRLGVVIGGPLLVAGYIRMTRRLAVQAEGRARAEARRAAAEGERAEAEARRAEAERERAEAEHERAEAEHERAEAESRRAEADRERAEAEALRAEEERRRRESDARAVRAAERVTIARELHDLVAHHVASMVLRIGVTRHVLPTLDPRVRQSLDDVHASGTAVLGDLRRLVGVLRDPAGVRDEPGLPLVDPEGLVAALEEVADRGRQVGLLVDASLDPSINRLDAVRALTVLRLSQEGVTNIARHAGPAARVRLSVEGAPDGAVRLELTDDGGQGHDSVPHPPGQGYGLIGMRERVELLGGRFQAGPTDHFEANPTDHFQADPADQFQADPTSRFQAGPTDHFQADPTDHFQVGPTDRFEADPTDRFQAGPADREPPATKPPATEPPATGARDIAATGAGWRLTAALPAIPGQPLPGDHVNDGQEVQP